MHIFLDESGTFSTTGARPHSISMVGALIVPDAKLPLLLKKYSHLRGCLPKSASGEVKGKLLDERQVAAVCRILFDTDALFEAVAVDMGLETPERIRACRMQRALGLTATLTTEHHPETIKRAWDLRRRMAAMSLPLYVQSIVTFGVLANVLYSSTLYYAQWRPRELSNFSWVIDGKEVNKVTPAEQWWSEAMLPLLEHRSLSEPIDVYDGGDYSYFMRAFARDTPEHLQPFVQEQGGMVSLAKILKNSFRFSSDPEPGLELVDIVTNATRRALQGNLQREGWKHIPRLILGRKKQYIPIASFGDPSLYPVAPYSQMVANDLSRGGRPLVRRPRQERRSRGNRRFQTTA